MSNLIALALIFLSLLIGRRLDWFYIVITLLVIIIYFVFASGWQKRNAKIKTALRETTDSEAIDSLGPVDTTVSPLPDNYFRIIVIGLAKGITIITFSFVLFFIIGRTPVYSLFYDRGYKKTVSDIEVLEQAKAYEHITVIAKDRLSRSLSADKQKVLAGKAYQTMIDWGNNLTNSTARIQKFSEARDFAKKWNLDSQLAEAKLESEKLKEVVTGPSNLSVGTHGTITQIDTSNFPPTIFVYVAVEDTNGEPIDWLKPKDFLISNNDMPITKFEVAPISSQDQSAIVLVMDVSGSTKGQPLISSQTGAQDFIAMLGDNDTVEIIKFNQSIRVLSSWQKDKQKLSQEIKKLKAQGNTAIYDALNRGLDDLAKAEQGQRAIVLFTDGADTHSKCLMKTVLDKAKMAQIPIYVIGLKSEDLSPETLNKIADETQGDYQEADNPDKLSECYQKIGNKIKKQYRIVITVSGSNLPVQNNLTISIGRKNGINLAKSYER